jgi:8-oxo-dGTP pyrophosphatase MutT (NUDIX family)
VTEPFDPATVPVRPASTVMIIDDRPELEVLMMRRSTKMVFAGGMWVFPGGAVDPGEADEFEPHCDGLDDATASRTLGLDDGGLAYWVAAIRENFEEAGLLLAKRRDGGEVATADFAADRTELHAGRGSFGEFIRREDLVLTAPDMHYIAHWVTPMGAPRRFTARFFLTRPPAGQSVSHDETETIDWAWVAPADMLARHSRGELTMMSPTVRMLQTLAKFSSAKEALSAADSSSVDEEVRVVYRPDGSYHIVVPGEEGYGCADGDRETGWIRLRPVLNV